MELAGLVEFLQTVCQLKRVKRSGWITHVGIKNPESVADHSFLCAVLAMCFGDVNCFNVQKTIRMLLLHDIHESIIGDFDQHAKEKIGSLQMEKIRRKAINEVLSPLPEKLKTNYRSLWEEFENQTTFEAIAARDIDKIEMMLQAFEYEKEGYNPQKLKDFWKSIRKEVRNPSLLGFFEVLVELRRRARN